MKKWVVGWLIVLMFIFIGKANAVTDPVGDPVVVFQDNCKVDSDCGKGAYCYQPPMPACPSGMACTDVMPNKICKQCTPRPEVLPLVGNESETEYIKRSGIVYCPVVKNCNVDSDCGKGAYCYQPPMPVCPIGTFCPQVLPRKVCTSISINNGDANGDGIVDLVDFSVWKTEYLNKTVSRADFNRDKIVDMTDFAVWKSYFIRITNNNI